MSSDTMFTKDNFRRLMRLCRISFGNTRGDDEVYKHIESIVHMIDEIQNCAFVGKTEEECVDTLNRLRFGVSKYDTVGAILKNVSHPICENAIEIKMRHEKKDL